MRDKDIGEKAKLKNPTHRVEYLRKLRKSGLITRNIDTRKYSLVARGWEMLYLWDVLKLVQERFNSVSSKVLVNRFASQDLEDAGIGLWQLEFFISEDVAITQIIKKFLFSDESLDTRLALSKVLHLADSLWRKHSLETFDAEEREVIEAYRDNLRDAAWILRGPSEEEWQRTRESFRIEVEEDLKARYPGVALPEELFEMETERRLQANKERRQNIHADMGELKAILDSKGEIPEVAAGKLGPLFEYLEDHKNAEIYGRYLEKVRACPKTVIISPSSGFRGYLERYWELFPEKRDYFRMSHP